MKPLSDFSKGELELWLRDLHASRSSRKMRLEVRIKAELESRQVAAAASVRKAGERNG